MSVVWFGMIALAVACIPMWATPSGPDPDANALERAGDRITIRSEPWFGRPMLYAIPFGVALLAVVLWALSLEVEAVIVGASEIGLAITVAIVHKLEHRITTARLDDETVEVVSPVLAGWRTRRYALRDVRTIDIVNHRAMREINSDAYPMRSVAIGLANGRRRRILLPMYDTAGDAFVDELRRRVAKAVAIGDPAIDALVEALAQPGETLYRGDHPIAIDADRRGVVLEDGAHRLAIRIERDGADVVVTIRCDDRVTTRRCDAPPTIEALERWITEIARAP